MPELGECVWLCAWTALESTLGALCDAVATTVVVACASSLVALSTSAEAASESALVEALAAGAVRRPVETTAVEEASARIEADSEIEAAGATEREAAEEDAAAAAERVEVDPAVRSCRRSRAGGAAPNGCERAAQRQILNVSA